MKTYVLIIAEEVPAYGMAEIQAADDAEAIAAAKAYDRDTVIFEPDWENSVCRRIVAVEDENRNIIAEQIPLDDFFLCHGREPKRLLCEAARQLATALDAAIETLSRISDALHYEHGLPVTFLESREIEDIYADAVSASPISNA